MLTSVIQTAFMNKAIAWHIFKVWELNTQPHRSVGFTWSRPGPSLIMCIFIDDCVSAHLYNASIIIHDSQTFKTSMICHNCDFLTEGVALASQRTHGAIMMSLLRRNDIVTSFWHNNDVTIASYSHWGYAMPAMPVGQDNRNVIIIILVVSYHW